MAALPELLPRGRSYRYAVSWAQTWVPALLEQRGEEFIRQCWVKVAKRKRRNLTTDQLSGLLKVTDDEPADLNLRCVPAASRNAKTREMERKAKKAQAEAARRLRNKPDLKPHSKSLMRTSPWDAAGISRTTWYERLEDEAPIDAVETWETAAPDGFVATVSDDPSRRIRGHQIPLPPLPDLSGLVVPGTEGADDNLRAPHHRKVAGNPLKDRADALRQSMSTAA